MSWLSNLELEKLIHKYGDDATKKAFMGVYAIDTLPQSVPHLPALLIVNTDTKNLPGQHWKSIYITKERFGEVFDSLSGPISTLLSKWLNTFTRKWTYNTMVVQHPFSPTCGAFAAYFILTRLKNKSMKEFMRIYSRSLYKNSIMMQTFVKDLSE